MRRLCGQQVRDRLQLAGVAEFVLATGQVRGLIDHRLGRLLGAHEPAGDQLRIGIEQGRLHTAFALTLTPQACLARDREQRRQGTQRQVQNQKAEQQQDQHQVQ